MGTVQQDFGRGQGPWGTLVLADAGAPPADAMPAGWWLVPGVVIGLGLWALLGWGLHAALTEESGAPEVTMAAAFAND